MYKINLALQLEQIKEDCEQYFHLDFPTVERRIDFGKQLGIPLHELHKVELQVLGKNDPKRSALI